MKYQLSDPFDDDFVNIFWFYDHTRRDAMITNTDEFFSNIIGDAYKKVSEASIFAKDEHSDSVVHEKVLHMRTGLITFDDKRIKTIAIFLGRILIFHMRKSTYVWFITFTRAKKDIINMLDICIFILTKRVEK